MKKHPSSADLPSCGSLPAPASSPGFFARSRIAQAKCQKTLAALAAFAAAAPALAADLQDWQSGKPQNLAALPARVKVVNIWATWCAPCLKEMPAMSAWYRKQNKKELALVGIAVDRRESIGAFLKKTPVAYPIWHYAGNDSRAFMKTLGNTFGGVPYTVVYAENCGKRQNITGEADAAKLDAAVKAVKAQCRPG